MEEIRELIERTAKLQAVEKDALLEDFKFAMKCEQEISATLSKSPRSPRQILTLLLESEKKKSVNRYGVTSVASAMAKLEREDPEYMKSVKRKYEIKEAV